MAFVHGKNSTFKLDTSGGALTDLSSYASNINFPLSLDTAEVSTFGTDSKQYVVGLKDCQFTVDFNWDAAVDEHLFALYGAAAGTFEYSPDGTNKYSGEAFLVGYNPASAINDAVKGSATFQVTGDVERNPA
jgi:hypothetical protein